MHMKTLIRTTNGPVHIAHLTAPVLDRLADAELQHGHHVRAEQLAQLAAEIRETAP